MDLDAPSLERFILCTWLVALFSSFSWLIEDGWQTGVLEQPDGPLGLAHLGTLFSFLASSKRTQPQEFCFIFIFGNQSLS